MKITRVELDSTDTIVSERAYEFDGEWFHQEMLLHHEKSVKVHYINTETGEQFPPEIETLLEARFKKQG